MITKNEQIHILSITKAKEKQLFQVKLPKNAIQISGIFITAQLDNTPQPPAVPALFSLKAGDIRLQLTNKKDIFYAADVCASEILPDYEKLTGIKNIDFNQGSFIAQGANHTALAVTIETKDTIIAGSYSDAMPAEDLYPYQVKIYITYQTNP